MKESELIRIKREIDQAKTTISELKGERTALTRQLKEVFGCETEVQAREKLKTMDTDISSLSTKIENGLKNLEEKYTTVEQ